MIGLSLAAGAERKPGDGKDAYLAATAVEQRDKLASFDDDLRAFPDFTTLPPQYYSAWKTLRFTFDWKINQ